MTWRQIKRYTVATDDEVFQSFGPNRHSALVFAEHAEEIRRETGIDVFEMEERRKADAPVLLRLLKRYRGKFADESIFDELWQEYLRLRNIPTREEQRERDEYSLAKARATKEELRSSGMADAARFGYCKRTGCANRKIERLLLRGFCPDCRGATVKQGAASITAFVDSSKIHPKRSATNRRGTASEGTDSETAEPLSEC